MLPTEKVIYNSNSSLGYFSGCKCNPNNLSKMNPLIKQYIILIRDIQLQAILKYNPAGLLCSWTGKCIFNAVNT